MIMDSAKKVRLIHLKNSAGYGLNKTCTDVMPTDVGCNVFTPCLSSTLTTQIKGSIKSRQSIMS